MHERAPAKSHPVRAVVLDMVAPIALYDGIRAAGGSVWLADAVARVVMACTLPVGLVPALGAALWPATLVVLQVVTSIHFARSGFSRILREGAPGDAAIVKSRSLACRDLQGRPTR